MCQIFSKPEKVLNYSNYYVLKNITRLRVKSKTTGRLFQNEIKTMSRPFQDHVFQEYVSQGHDLSKLCF